MASITEYDTLFKQPDLDSSFTKDRFINKVAIVTGGASGIGRATVERFCNDGAFVAIFDLDDKLGRDLEDKLNSQGKKAKLYHVDVSNKDQCFEAVKMVADDNGGMVNFLVNCAVFFGGLNKPIIEATKEIWRKTMDVNVIGVSNMVQACFPYMKTDGKQCAVVNIGSVRGKTAGLNHSVYCAAKGAVHILTKCMALDLSNVGIRVNTVSPGWVWTPPQVPFHDCDGRGGKFEDMIGLFHMTPRCLIESAGVASAVAFLCSNDAMYIDGADLPVDCGWSAMGPEGLGKQ